MISAIRKELPRLPLDGKLDLTYRCNNKCRHCWLWLASDSPLKKDELSFDEIRFTVDEARAMGCQTWGISGGEPMLREDFPEIFDYITRRSLFYSLNTNGTLITPEIARLMVRNGRKMVALYGATAEVHDRVTRNPGSFEAAMRGFAYLKEAGASFIVQVVPMQENYHQYQEMLALADSLSPHTRMGASWLWLSGCRSETRNREISRQRLDPADIIALEEPHPIHEDFDLSKISNHQLTELHDCGARGKDDRLFAKCIAARRDFHIDPYGQMSFCYYVKDHALRYNLRQGTFQKAWDEFIPSLADSILGGQEYLENCGSCEFLKDCRWCAVYAYLEHGRYSAKIDYLCQVAIENKRYKEQWKLEHIRYYQIAGITIQVVADFPFKENTYSPVLNQFQVDGPGDDNISIRLVSSVPKLSELRLGEEVYRGSPWVIYRQPHSWVYLTYPGDEGSDQNPYMVSLLSDDYREVTICRLKEHLQRGTFANLTTFSSDQILLAQVMALRQACVVHAGGFVLNGQGLLFVGHSEAGKSTMLKMLREHGQILCDDRMILRRWPEGFRIHGTWSHGELPDVSPASAPIRAIMYLEKSPNNALIPLEDTRERLGRFLSHVIKPFVSADWWEHILALSGMVAAEIPAYRLQFDKSGQVVDLLRELSTDLQHG